MKHDITLSHKRRFYALGCILIACLIFLTGRSAYVCIGQSRYFHQRAIDIQERTRTLRAQRGLILDRNGIVLAENQTVYTVSVIHNQITEPQRVVKVLSELLNLDEKSVAQKVEKYSSIERIKRNVPKEIGDQIRKLKLNGVKVDEDFKRFYPHGRLASKILGFTGGDYQGIIGLESVYDSYLKGIDGYVAAVTDVRGIEIENASERRSEPEKGKNLQLTLDANIQMYATQLAETALLQKEAKSASVIVMDVKNGEILAMVNAPEFDLNEPFELGEVYKSNEGLKEEEKTQALNDMWRNGCINDTYEPGSAFKVITCAAALEEKLVDLETPFYCPGYIVVKDRKIRCARTQGHGSQDLIDATKNSCNPAYISIGMRLGTETFYDYFMKFHILEKTGIDLPGEAKTIMHKKENIGPVELATISFGQSFQVTPIGLLTTIAGLINNGERVTPHLAKGIIDENGDCIEEFEYPVIKELVSKDTSEKLRGILELVVSEGGGSNAKVEGFRVGGKTATSQTIPRGNGIYIASFVGFAPADDPKVIAIAIVNAPKGVYYGGMIAAPIIRQLFENILPYLEVK